MCKRDLLLIIIIPKFSTTTTTSTIIIIIITLQLFLSYFFIVVPMHKCLDKHLCMSSTFPLARLNGTCFLSSNKTVVWSGSRAECC